MRNFHRSVINTRTNPFLTFVIVLSMFCVLTPLSGATTPTLTISVVNNSQRAIRHVFLASAGSDNWGDDQLSEAISAGTSRNINADWSESAVKIVAEDQEGCFLTTTVDTAGSPNWTITSDTPRNCGN
jgi:hypothetical protein